MPQKGEQKQVPPDQRSRGKNLEHPEGRANDQNQQAQKAETKPGTGTEKP